MTMLRSVCIAALAAVSTSHTAPQARTAGELAFASRRDGNWEIYVADASGGNQRRLTRRAGEDRFPMWSPDRRHIAFASLNDGHWQLWVMSSDGANQKLLASDIIPKSSRGWSLDGKRIVFSARSLNNIDIYTVDVTSGTISRLTSSPGEDRDPSWGPADSQIAFTSDRSGTPRIHVMRADGEEERAVTDGVSPAWSPDGKLIAFICGTETARDLCVVNADGSDLQRLTSRVHVTRDAPRWSPNASTIAFQVANDQNYDIGVVSVPRNIARDTLRPGARIIAASAAYDGSYAWSPDGSRIAFISARAGDDRLYTTGADGANVRRLTSSPSLTPAWGVGR